MSHRLAAAALCAITSGAVWAADLLADGDFERPGLAFGALGTPGVWSVSIHDQSDVSVTLAAGEGRDGSRCVLYHKTDAGSQNVHVDQVVTVQPETLYELTAWVRGDGTLEPLFSVTGLDWHPLQNVSCGKSAQWRRVRVVFDSYRNRQVRIEWFPGANGQLYTALAGTSRLDDVALQPLADAPAALRQAFELSRPRPEELLAPSTFRPGPIGSPAPLRPIRCRDGVLEYEGGGEVALFGLNIQTALSWEYQGRLKPLGLPLDAATLNRIFDENLEHLGPLGAGIIRAHLLPSDFSDAEGDLQETVYLDALDHMLAKCGDEGIYVYLTLLNDMNTHVCPSSFMEGHARDTWLFDDPFVARTEHYYRALLTHRNRYTGRPLAAEPALGIIELMNEPGYLDAVALGAYRPGFESWLGLHAPGETADALFAAYRYDRVKSWLERMCAAVRGAGVQQPIIWNLNWPGMVGGHEDVYQAVADSPVDGVSFCCYPGQEDVKSPFWANPAELSGKNKLPYVRTCYEDYGHLRWLLGKRFQHKAKCVYEFETMYNQSAYLYPAMAALFRGLGAQVAMMWEYTLSPVAERAGGSHYLNLYCTPRKAASFRVASEVFGTTPRYAPFALHGDSEVLAGTWAASFDHDLSLYANPDTLLYSGSLDGRPVPVPASPRTIAGCGSSPRAEWGGTGMYWLSVDGNTIDLTLAPDAESLRPAWQPPTKDRALTCRLDATAEHRFALHLPGWEQGCWVERLEAAGPVAVATEGGAPAFTAKAGRYRITRAAR